MSKRPVLQNLIKDNTLSTESFQNKTLRPIIKMQHPILIALFNNYLSDKKIDFQNLSINVKKDKIESILQKDSAFKKTIIGVIIGHFSNDELTNYFKNISEFDRRIRQIVAKRLQDSLDEIK